MLPIEYFAIEFIDQSWAESATGAESGGATWIADHDTDLSEKIALRNADISQSLAALIPELTSTKEGLELEDYADERLSQEAVLRRYHRCRILSCNWCGGVLEIRIYDSKLDVSFQMVNLLRADLPRFKTDLQALLAKIEKASGMKPWHSEERRIVAIDVVVHRLLESHATSLARHFRATRRERVKRNLAIPSLVLSGLFAFALSFGIARDALKGGELLSNVQGNATATFVTDRMLPPQYRLGVFPKFSLLGHIEGQTRQQVLPVFRNEFLRAGLGAPYTVLPTGDANQPYILQTKYENGLPLVRLGGFAFPLHAALAVLPIGFWYFYFLKPLINLAPHQREVKMSNVSSRFGMVLLGGMAIIALTVLRQFL